VDLKNVAREVSTSIALVVVYIVVYVVVSALAKYVIHSVLPTYGVAVADYEVYVQILLALAFGYLIVSAVARFFYWSTVVKYGHSTAAAVRNVVRIVGIGAMVAAIAGGVAGGAAGVALGGFLGMVVGFASQQVLGQAIAGALPADSEALQGRRRCGDSWRGRRGGRRRDAVHEGRQGRWSCSINT
jgi:small-conductance mechanosensitive channel